MDERTGQTSAFKRCAKCGDYKSRNLFSKRTISKDGLYHMCKECKGDYAALHYHKNREKLNAQSKAYHAANPARIAAKAGKACAIRAVGRDCIPDDFTIDSTIPFFTERIRMSAETGNSYRVIHVVPLSKGGLHCATNLKVVTARDE